MNQRTDELEMMKFEQPIMELEKILDRKSSINKDLHTMLLESVTALKTTTGAIHCLSSFTDHHTSGIGRSTHD